VLTLLVATATVAITVLLYVVIPKGFFPLQDTGFVQGITLASPSISFSAMAEQQQALAEAILKDKAVDSLTSFIGVDGTNSTLNTGRMLINLKAKGDRDGIQTVLARIQKETANIAGISLYMQPVQDLTTDSTVSRAEYEFFLEAANNTTLDEWVPKLLD